MARLAERLYNGVFSYALCLSLSLLVSCSGAPKTSDVSGIIRTSTITGNISNLSSFGVTSADEFRVYSLNTEGRGSYANISASGSFSLSVPSNSLYLLYVLQDTDGDGSHENHIGTFDAIAGGALDLIPIYTSDYDLGTFSLPTGGAGIIDLAANPAIGQDMDADGVLDDVDDDINGNGLIDTDDLVVLDRDEDSVPNPIDIDRDGDLTNNAVDYNQFDPTNTPLPYEQDSDGDGIEDIYDLEPTSLYGSLNVYYVTGRITYVPPSENLTAVIVTTRGRFIRSVVDEHGNFNIPVRERSLFLLYFMSGNVISNGQNTSDFRGIIDTIPGGMPNGIAMGSSNLNLGNLTLPANPLNRALNLSITIMANRDSDGDGQKDSVDLDKDGNGIADVTEISQLNFDGDLLPNNLDTDDDNDGDLDGVDTDRDGDGLADPIDSDNDGVSDSNDIDYDNDGQLDGSNPTLIETPDLDVPIVGTNLSFPAAQIQPYSLRVTWGYARDNATPANLLEYRVVHQRAASNLIDTAAKVAALDPLALPADVVIVRDWTVNINQADATGLQYDETYYFAVLVRDEAGNQSLYGAPSSQITTDTTAPVRGTAVTTNSPAAGPNNINVAWGAATDNVSLPGALEYKLVFASTSAAIDTVAEAELADDVPMDWTAGATNFNVTSLSELTTYHFAVLVRDEAGNISLYTPVAGTTTDVTAPDIEDGPYFSGIAATSVTVGWDAATDNTTPTASLQYRVVSSTTAGGTDIDTAAEVAALDPLSLPAGVTIIRNWVANITSANVTGLAQDTEYFFAVVVRDASGNMSIFSPANFVTGNVTAPTFTGVITFPNKTDTTIDLAWNEASDDATLQDLLEYKVVMGSTATSIDTIAEVNAVVGANLIHDWTADIQSASVTGLTSGVRYYFNVIVRDGAGNISIYGPQSTVTSDILPPNPGVMNPFSSTTASQTTVNWSATTDSTTPSAFLEYKLVVGTASTDLSTVTNAEANGTLVMDWTANTLTRIVTGLTDNTTYQFAVLVRDAALNKALYTPASVLTADGTAPTMGALPIFTGTIETQTTISWGAATDAVTLPANLQYKVVKASTSAAIDTAAEINAITAAPGLVMNWTAASMLSPLQAIATGLTASTTYFFAVAVKDEAGLVTVYTPQSVTTASPPNAAPTPGTGIVFSGTSDTQTVISWGAATDDLTAQANLQYKVVRGTSATDLSTVVNAETNGTVVMDWTTNVLTRIATGLTANTTYKFAVLVRDAGGLKANYLDASITTLAAAKVLFVSNNSLMGQFSITGTTTNTADGICDSEGKSRFNPSKTYKAVIVNGTTRTTSSNWTLAPNTTYKNRSGALIGTTTAAAVFTFPLTTAIDNLSSTIYAWTGLNNNWTTSSNLCVAVKNGPAWTANAQNKSGQVGSPYSTSNTSIGSTSRKCNTTARFYCAEQ